MSESYDTAREAGKGQSAAAYGRHVEPLPEIHIFSRLSELDAAYAADLAKRRARQETLEREIAALAKHLSAPLEGEEQEGARRGFFARLFGAGKSKANKGDDA
ncbi:hypothetical protein [Parvibaculum sp. MBR-TMA-1.3b-4.2]|jgi:hypothetical protein